MVQPVDLSFKGDVAWLTLNRPDESNAINLETAEALLRNVGLISTAGSRVAVISGAGGTFCSGGDVVEMAEASNLSTYVRQLAGTFHDALIKLAELNAVIIAAVDGVAARGGLGLALAADIQLASNRSMFLTSYESLGLTPDSGTSFLLPRSIGISQARQMFATGMRLDATFAAGIGLVHKVVRPDELPDAASELASRLAARPQLHMSQTRTLFWGADSGEYRRHLDAERDAISDAARTPQVAALISEVASRAVRSRAARRKRTGRHVS